MNLDPPEQQEQIIRDIRVQANRTGSYAAAILSTAALVPLLATFASVASYVIQVQPPWFALLSSSLIVALGWLLTAGSYRRNTAVDRADTSSYEFLLNHLEELERSSVTFVSNLSPIQNTMYIKRIQDIRAYLQTIAASLKIKGGVWVAGTGYVSISRLMHRADEALLDLAPVETIIVEALRDEAALTNSTIPNKDDLLNRLQLAMKMLETTIDPSQSRSIIREVRFTLNQFRDDQWEKLIRARNHLTQMTIMTGCVLYLLVSFAILTGTRSSIITAATFYFLTGVIIGLFSRLFEQSKLDTTIDDARLATSRLMAAPLFSGLAAIGGVLITQKIVVLGANYTFDTLNAYNFLVAAAFGLTPSLLIGAIQKQADQYKVNLKSTEGTTEKKPPGQ